MAWIDDRIYCHPKVLRVSKPARWTYIAGIAYSAGWQTHGILERGALEAIGCEPKQRRELVAAGLWAELEGLVVIHDWEEHNGRRDARRAADRERKRRTRNSGMSAGHDADKQADKHADETRKTARTSTLPARVDGSEGSEGKNPRHETALEPLVLDSSPTSNAARARIKQPANERLLAAVGGGAQAKAKLTRTIDRWHSPEGDLEYAIECAAGPGVDDPLAVALALLKQRGEERNTAWR